MDGHKYSARMLKALAHPVRLQILDALSTDVQACVCHLESLLQLRQAYISQQLATLREAGLVQDRREGLNVYYSLTSTAVSDGLQNLRSFSSEIAQIQDKKLQFKSIEHDPGEPCPCPRCHEKIERLEPMR
ncbi:MAG: transcriptional regulator [Anaerolineales bacterium]|nr:MAG: transcriptional regulator [Anaerolineales bacterium]